MTTNSAPDDVPTPAPEVDTEWSPKLAYPVTISVLGLVGIGSGLVTLISGGGTLSSVLLLVAGAILLVMGLDQFRRTPRLQLLPDGLIYFGLRGRRFVESELVHEVRVMRGRRRGVAALVRIEYFRDHAEALKQRDSEGPVDGELLLLSRTEVGGNPREVADVLAGAGYNVIDATG